MSTRTSQSYPKAVAGIHLSGANVAKTSVVILSCLKNNQIALSRVYEKIGSVGSLFSDERLVDILNLESPLQEVFIDCPLTLPPCVRCVRARCPGVWECDDLDVAYMMSVQELAAERSKSAESPTKKRRKRPLNPQSQRLWDVLQLQNGQRVEPSFSANMAPLVARAMTLQRRLRTSHTNLQLKETQVSKAVHDMCEALELEADIGIAYKKFGVGLEHRARLFDALVESGLLAPDYELTEAIKIRNHLENFQAFVTAVMAAFHVQNQTSTPARGFDNGEGWVYSMNLTRPFEGK